VSKLRVEECLSHITGTLKALVESVEAHQDLNTTRELDEQLILMFDDRCNPKGSNVFRFGADNS
jgi:hypothetical protein